MRGFSDAFRYRWLPEEEASYIVSWRNRFQSSSYWWRFLPDRGLSVTVFLGVYIPLNTVMLHHASVPVPTNASVYLLICVSASSVSRLQLRGSVSSVVISYLLMSVTTLL